METRMLVATNILQVMTILITISPRARIEEIPDEEEAAEEIADEVEAADGEEDAGGDKYIASDDDPDYEKSESEDEEEIDEEEAPPL